MRRGLALFVVLLGAYAATLGLDDRTSAEAHRLLVADSIVHDRDVDVADEYRERAWTDFYDGELRPGGRVVGGRLLEPAGIGTPLVVAPAYAIGGATLAELWCAALLALAFALALGLARRIVPDPWATRATLVCGLSPPALEASTTIGPAAPSALLLTGAALLALGVRERPRLSRAAASSALLAPLPWISPRAVPLGAVVALAMYRWLRRRRRGLAGLVALELVLVSAVAYVAVNERLFGGLTPASARAFGPAIPSPRPGDLGELLVRAPVLLLAGAGVWLLWRSRRTRLAVVAARQADVETAAALCACLTVVAIAWPREPMLMLALPAAAGLVAWGLRFLPRPGAVLALATLAQSAWLLARF
ncbi:MAG TPA: hypothetical protein VFZ89_20035 [Solirubrobacteraceae bacterium]